MAERPPVRAWRIHVGAHKTATTHLQQTLAAHRGTLEAAGLDYIPFRDFRAAAWPYVGGWRRRLWSPPVARGFRRRIDGLRRGPDTVLISDEDILGVSRDLLADPVYPAPRALHLVGHLAGRGGAVTLFLGVRSFDTILPSAYAQALKADPFAPGSFDAICRRMAAAPPSWLPLVERLHAAVPGARLRVWRHEDYRAHWRDIIAAYAGRAPADLGTLPEVPPVRGTASPAPEAVRRAEALDPAMPKRDRITAVREIFARYPAGDLHGRLAPFTAAETDRLRARYAADIAGMENRWPGMLIQPGATVS